MVFYLWEAIMEQIFCSSDITELAKAMLKVQTELQPALKDKENPFTKSTYATLNSVINSCKEVLVNNGIWLVQYPVPVEHGSLGLVTKLIHVKTGQWQSSLLVMPLPKADPQGYGSALTYGRRYSLSALVGIVTEEDDDGENASLRPQQKRKTPQSVAQPSPRKDAETAVPNSGHPVLAAMPKLDGINYESVNTTDGKLCIVATGDTRAKKQILTQAGFRWSPERRIWWRYAETA
jgi:hypothetical protein